MEARAEEASQVLATEEEGVSAFDRDVARVITGELRAVESILETIDEYDEDLVDFGLERGGVEVEVDAGSG